MAGRFSTSSAGRAGSREDCFRYWDMCSTYTLDAVVALWCDVGPGELKSLGFSTSCMDAKREAIIDALRGGRLDYQKRPVPRSDGRGLWHDAGLDELIEKDGVRVEKDSLRRWFLDMPFDDRPAFLFDETRQAALLPDGGQAGEMNTMRALGLMAWLLTENKSAFAIGGRPNAAAIGKALEPLAARAFGENTRGLASFHKKISRALALLPDAAPFHDADY